MPPRIMYIESKADGLSGPARIGLVYFSQTGRTLYYRGRAFAPFNGFKANYRDVATGHRYWISGCKRRGGDRLYPGLVEIDPDARAAYWTTVRHLPARQHDAVIRCDGKYAT